MNDDVYMYTGITSISSDESNIGFVLVNLRTHEARFYDVPGAEEYSQWIQLLDRFKKSNIQLLFHC